MVEIFGVINEAIGSKRDKKPAEQLAYASELVSQRSQSGSAKIYADGLSQASRQAKGKAATPDNISALLGSLLGGQAPCQSSSNSTMDLLGSLLGGVAGSQPTSSQSGLDMGDLLNAGMAFMSSQQQGEGGIQSIIKAFVAASQAGQSKHRAQSGELVTNTIIQMLGKSSSR
jgi:hypothetical protein